MSAKAIDPDIDALRAHLGSDARFCRFIASIPASGEQLLLFWQSRELDSLEHREGIVFPRDPAALAALLQPLLPRHSSLPADDVPPWITFDELGGQAPVQASGRIPDLAASFYFRARNESWSIGISTDPTIDPVDVSASTDDCFFHEEPFGHLRDEASEMPLDIARFFIVRELSRWRGLRAGRAG